MADVRHLGPRVRCLLLHKRCQTSCGCRDVLPWSSSNTSELAGVAYAASLGPAATFMPASIIGCCILRRSVVTVRICSALLGEGQLVGGGIAYDGQGHRGICLSGGFG